MTQDLFSSSDAVPNTLTLYKNLSPQQFAGAIKNDWRRFARLPEEQLIFSPKLYRAHAEMLARQLDACMHTAGYVVAFSVDAEYMQRFSCKSLAYDEQLEYWIPAEEILDLNQHINGNIYPVAMFIADKAARERWRSCSGLR